MRNDCPAPVDGHESIPCAWEWLINGTEERRVHLYVAAAAGRAEWIYGVTQPWRTTNEGAQASSVRVG